MEVEGTQVVEAEDVVGVGVGEQHGVDAFDLGVEGLLTEVRPGVNDDDAFAVANDDGGAQTAVARVRGPADFAVAPDGGNADTGA